MKKQTAKIGVGIVGLIAALYYYNSDESGNFTLGSGSFSSDSLDGTGETSVGLDVDDDYDDTAKSSITEAIKTFFEPVETTKKSTTSTMDEYNSSNKASILNILSTDLYDKNKLTIAESVGVPESAFVAPTNGTVYTPELLQEIYEKSQSTSTATNKSQSTSTATKKSQTYTEGGLTKYKDSSGKVHVKLKT